MSRVLELELEPIGTGGKVFQVHEMVQKYEARMALNLVKENDGTKSCNLTLMCFSDSMRYELYIFLLNSIIFYAKMSDVREVEVRHSFNSSFFNTRSLSALTARIMIYIDSPSLFILVTQGL